ncbi:PREDICTED: glucan endo-1,3-beta-glucosidase-like [Camelina sativa]|uniref:Glucan endo-1,3-beta-glucosidase-like n=1 Tax=Camelina sativa TaxID=90675 RepID=A0ABM1RLB7_CAMSA|nr:PREDICTED: glucan endo-1,3-beta-glucosidase-like [Camelina sativa]
MAKAQICICFIIFLSLWSECFCIMLFEFDLLLQSPGKWCVAKPSTATNKLQQNIDYACSKVDCKIISKGGACYSPDSLISTASVAMNLYYQTLGRDFWSCQFEGSAFISVTDPSYGNCIYTFHK